MSSKRFDRLTVAVASGRSRRAIFRELLGGDPGNNGGVFPSAGDEPPTPPTPADEQNQPSVAVAPEPEQAGLSSPSGNQPAAVVGAGKGPNRQRTKQNKVQYKLAPINYPLDGTQPADRNALGGLALERARMGASWLARIVQPDGSFPYVYYPRTDKYDTERYNEVRHAGTTYSLFQASGITPDSAVNRAAEAAAMYIAAASLPTPFGGRTYAYRERTKLGGQVLALVALLERRRVTADHSFDGLISDMATFLQRMELADQPGRYHQSYLVDSEQLLLTPDSDYYPGEALLALTRLAQQFPTGSYLDAAKRAAAYLIHVRDGDQIKAVRVPRQDHWLTMALSELYQLDPNPNYATIAYLQADTMIASQHQTDDPEPWRIGGSYRPTTVNFTSTATKAEAMNAAWGLAILREDTAAVERYATAALRTAQFLMRVQYTSENTGHFPRPDRTIGAWAQDIANPRVRIDFVQHNISALLGAHALVTHGKSSLSPPPAERAGTTGPPITILQTGQFDGPNIWSLKHVTRFVVDLSGAENRDNEDVARVAERVRGIIDSLKAPGSAASESQGIRSELGDSPNLAEVIGRSIIDLQRRAGINVGFYASRLADAPGHYEIVAEHDHADAALAAGDIAVQLVTAALNGNDPDRHITARFREKIVSPIQSWELTLATQAVVDSALKQGIPVQRVKARPSLVEFGNGSYRRRIQTMTTSQTSRIGIGIAGRKNLTNYLLRNAGLPVPQGEDVRTVDHAINAAERIGYPVVLKPNGRNHAHGVYVNLESDQQIRQFFPLTAAEARSRSVLVERFIVGNEYRILVINDRVIAVYERLPAHVIGDGERTIQELIDLANTDPRRRKDHPSPLKEITIGVKTVDKLERQGLRLEDVPPAGKHILLQPTGLIGGGGSPVDVTDTIHADNVAIARQAAQAVKLDIAGLDVITPDISLSMWECGGAIVEVNSGPGFRYHLNPAEGKPRDIGRAVIDMLYPPGQPVRAPVVAIAGDDSTVISNMIGCVLDAAGHSMGRATSDGLFIDGMHFAQTKARGPAGARMLLNNPAVEVAVVEVEAQEIIDEGLGFDRCDVVVVTALSGQSTPAGRLVEHVLLDTLVPGGIAVLNADDPPTAALTPVIDREIVLYSLDASHRLLEAHIQAGGRAVAPGSEPKGDALVLFEGAHQATTILPRNRLSGRLGDDQLAGTFAAVAAAVAHGVPVDIIQQSLTTGALS